MFSNNRKTIGVFAENTANEFQNLLCDGIIREARDRGYNVAVFSPYGSYGQSKIYSTGDMQLYKLPSYEELDGVLLVLDTVNNDEDKNQILNIIKSRCTCPIVSLRMDIPGFNNVLVNNTSCLEEIIRHFIEYHKLTKLAFMSGPVVHFDAKERLDSFLRLIDEYHLPHLDHQIFYGDFWKYHGKEACDWFLSGSEQPEAIICANDYMAISVASELIGRGYRIPDDIFVSGYDGLSSTIAFSPSITTAQAPFADMGRQGVILIDEQQDPSKRIPRNIYMKSKLCLHESCGCMRHNDNELISTRRNLHEILEQNSHRADVFSFLSTRLAEAKTLDEVSVIIPPYLGNIDHLRSYAVCLNQDMRIDQKLTNYTQQVDIRIAMVDHKPLEHINFTFDKKELLPAMLTDSDPQAWYFVPLHFLDYCMGYEAIRFEDTHPAGICNLQYDVLLCNKIYETLINEKMEKIIEELQLSSMHDALTGLYNRGGFTHFGGQLFQSTCRHQVPAFVAVVDMDNLKKINDSFGHIEGDFAIKKVANAISACCSDRYIFARTGGDEFYIIGQNITEEDGSICMNQIEQELQAFNATGTKPYDIHASSGIYTDTPAPGDTLDDFIKVADRFMYHNKIENKKKRGEHLR